VPTRALVLFCLAGCGSAAQTTSPDGGVDGGVDGGGGCALSANTSATTTVTGGCTLLDRDTSGCLAARQAAGLDGAWLKFSCRVTLAVSGSNVQLSSDSRPDRPSNYFATGDACHEDFTTQFPDPNHIAAQSIVVTVPRVPSGAAQNMGLGAVGLAVDGVAIYDNQAAPGDDIFLEVGSFDRCQGHPDQRGGYHYHSEPYAISYADDRLIGVLRDGSFVYGRLDADGSVPQLDAHGGHSAPTPDSSAAVYHYHANLQTSMSGSTSGQTAWFLTTGSYGGAPGTCSGC